MFIITMKMYYHWIWWCMKPVPQSVHYLPIMLEEMFSGLFLLVCHFFSPVLLFLIFRCVFFCFQRLVCYQPHHDMPQTQDCNNAFVNWILEVIFVYAIFSRYKKRPDRTLCRLCLFVFVCVYLSLFLCVCLRAWVKCTVSHLNLWDFTEPKKAVIVNI